MDIERSLDLTDDDISHTSTRFPRPIAFIQPVFTMGGGGKIYYPKEVWSPAGGWYAQPGNWRANTAAMGAVILGISVFTWSLSAEREYRDKMPEPGRFFPSRYWSKQIIEHEKATKESS